MRPEGLCQLKTPVITSGMDTATFRLVAQRPSTELFIMRCLKFSRRLLSSGMWRSLMLFINIEVSVQIPSPSTGYDKTYPEGVWKSSF